MKLDLHKHSYSYSTGDSLPPKHPQDVFNIVTHPKFSSGISEKYGKKMFSMLAEHMEHFSEKQQLTLSRLGIV